MRADNKVCSPLRFTFLEARVSLHPGVTSPPGCEVPIGLGVGRECVIGRRERVGEETRWVLAFVCTRGGVVSQIFSVDNPLVTRSVLKPDPR